MKTWGRIGRSRQAGPIRSDYLPSATSLFGFPLRGLCVSAGNRLPAGWTRPGARGIIVRTFWRNHAPAVAVSTADRVRLGLSAVPAADRDGLQPEAAGAVAA